MSSSTTAPPSASSLEAAASQRVLRSWRRAARYCSSLVFLAAVYWSYSFLVVPWIEPPAPPSWTPVSRGSSAAPQTVLSSIDLKRHFPPGAWQLSAKVLETKHGVLVFGDDTREGEKITLKPVTMIFVTERAEERAPAAPPIIVDAPSGAELVTTKDAKNALAMGEPVAGRLLGEINIRRAATAGENNALHIVTRNVQIDKYRISTPHEVRFTLGPHWGVGRDLEILLETEEEGTDPPAAADRGGDSDADAEPSGGEAGLDEPRRLPIRSLELVRLEKLVFYVDEQSAQSPPAPGAAAPQPAAVSAAEPARLTPIEVTCQGPFRLDMQRQVATLEDHVDLARIPEDGVADVLSCQVLEIFFDMHAAPPEEDAAEGRSESARGAWQQQVREIVASGFPVRLRSASSQTEARGEVLRYEVASKRLSLVSQQEPVVLTHGGRTVTAARLDYVLHPEDPSRMGQLWAAGPGRLQGTMGKRQQQQEFSATWQRLLRLQPIDGKHVVSFYEDVQLQFGAAGSFAADNLHLYLLEVPQPAAAGQPAQYAVFPHSLLAEGSVDIDSPQMSAQTEEVHVWFRPQVTPPARPAGEQGEPAGAAGAGLIQQPGARPARPGAGGQGAEPATRLAAQGQLLQVQLRYNPQFQMSLDELQVTGDVVVRQAAVGAAESEFRVTGSSLRMTGAEMGRMVVRLSGQPARIESGDGWLESAGIVMDQQRNFVQADGVGALSFHVQPAAQKGTPIYRPTVMRWQGGMHFDGRRVRLRGDVQFSGEGLNEHNELLRFSGSGQLLDVSLTEPLVLAQLEQIDSQPLMVQDVQFSGQVLFENRTIRGGQPQSLDKLQVERLDYNRPTGKFTALGPGWASTTRRESSTAVPGSRPAPASRPAPGAATRPAALQYLRVEFQRQIDGNAKFRDLEFSDQVRCVYGPVQSWEQVVEDGTRAGSQGVELTCRTLRVAQLKRNGEVGMNLDARGNTRIVGESFDAHAERLTYDQLKDLMVLDGDPRAGVVLRFAARPGAEPTTLNADYLKFWPKTKNVEGEFRTLNAGPIGTPPR